jgi:hypothetical protein
MFIKVLKGETEIVPERSATFNINDKLQFLNESTASFHRCLLFGIDGIFRLTNSFFSIYILYKLYYGDISIGIL